MKNYDELIKSANDTMMQLHQIILELHEEIERLNNIIKKVREYIQDRYDGEVLTHTFDKDNVGELLEILKGSE